MSGRFNKTMTLRIATLLLAAFGAALGLSSCITNSDRDYPAELSRARSDCRGDEIVGVWVAAPRGGLGESWRSTLLLRPDGTGKLRHYQPNFDPKGTEMRLRWTYAGQGVWQLTGEMIEQTSNVIMPFVRGNPIAVRWTGSRLLSATTWSVFLITTTDKVVWVRANDDVAVTEFLRNR
jgi:hypothetical protein